MISIVVVIGMRERKKKRQSEKKPRIEKKAAVVKRTMAYRTVASNILRNERICCELNSPAIAGFETQKNQRYRGSYQTHSNRIQILVIFNSTNQTDNLICLHNKYQRQYNALQLFYFFSSRLSTLSLPLVHPFALARSVL